MLLVKLMFKFIKQPYLIAIKNNQEMSYKVEQNLFKMIREE